MNKGIKKSKIKLVVRQNGESIYETDDNVIGDAIKLVSSVFIQLMPIWMLIIVMICTEISITKANFLENTLVFCIVACAGKLVSDRESDMDTGLYNRLLSILVVCLAAAAYLCSVFSNKNIGYTIGVVCNTTPYTFVTAGIYELTALTIYFDIKNKKSLTGEK